MLLQVHSAVISIITVETRSYVVLAVTAGTVCCMMVMTVLVWLQDRKGVKLNLAGPEPLACRPFCVVPPAARCVAGNRINDR